MFDVCLLGTGGMMPLPYRWLTSLMVRYEGSQLMIDCGEGTQIAAKEKGWSFKPIDVLCFTGHKGLLAPQGTGGLYVREGLTVQPLLSGGSGVQTYNKKHPVEMPTALEAGTLNGHGIAGMNAALAYLEETGIDTIREREQELMWKFYEGVKDIPNVTVYGDFSTKNRCAIVALNIGDYDSAEVSDELLTEYGISTRPGGHCAPLAHEALGNVEQGAVRFSFSHYNTDEEIETAIRAIEELAQDEE